MKKLDLNIKHDSKVDKERQKGLLIEFMSAGKCKLMTH